MNDMISVIVPVFNGSDYVYEFWELMKKQTYANFELIFIDDGSTDNTLEKLRTIQVEDNRIKIFTKENGGPSSARNYGMKLAIGDFITFIDVDDYVCPDYIKYMYKLILEEKADIAFCSYIKMGNDEKYKKKLKKKREMRKVFNREEAIKFFSYRKYLTGYSYLKLYKREIVNNISFNENIYYGEDFLFTYDILKKCNSIVYGNQIQYIYVQYQNSSTHIKRDNTKKYQKAWEEHLKILEDVRSLYPDAYKGMLGKCYILAINNTTRIYDKERDSEFLEQLYSFIKKNAYYVASDKEAKISNRILGMIGVLNIRFLCFVCKLLLLSNLQMIQRRTI